jgi:hypothetical protein
MRSWHISSQRASRALDAVAGVGRRALGGLDEHRLDIAQQHDPQALALPDGSQKAIRVDP